MARWRALANLLERPYWRRVWIVQEVVLAEKLRLQCGHDEARWEGLTNLLDPRGRKQIFEPRAVKKTIESVRSSLPAHIHGLRRTHQLRGCRLQEVLEATRNSLYTDPRDRIYGLLGIADDVGDGRFEVDYSGEPNIEAMLRGLWKYSVECNKPELVVQSCQHLGTRFLSDQPTDKDLMMRTVSSQPRPLYQVEGHRVGSIIYLGQPWKCRAELDRWQVAMGELCQRWTPSRMESQFGMLSKATAIFFLEDHYSKLGLVRRKAFAHLFEQDDEETGAQPYMQPVVEQPKISAGGKTMPQESAENEPFSSSIGKSFGDWDTGISWRLARRNVAVMIASNGQMGLVPGRVGAAGVRVGDSLCQFRDSDVTAVFRHMPDDLITSEATPKTDPNTRSKPVLVGKAILAKRPDGEKEWDEKIQLDYSRLDERYALRETRPRRKAWPQIFDDGEDPEEDTLACFDITGKGLIWLTSW
ncbi:HET-domain-containing protein [Apiospora marii]|uniref:HET-domain-containing protein n=2 Tax=Apiospora marii TaxID=335849 RepID=A0ABR1RBT3_9PEZI